MTTAHFSPRRISGLGIWLGLGALAFAGCGRDNERSPTTQPSTGPAQPAPDPTTPPAQPGSAAATANSISGTVVETMNSGGYTYAKIDDGKAQLWVAGPETALAIGTKIGNVTGTPMPGFHSDTLKRTFEQLSFIDAFPITGSAGPNPHGVPAAAVAMEKLERVAGGKTVAEIYAEKDTLVGKEVAVRGKVVKVNNAILNRNWVRLQDGTGSAGTNELMVTTSATVTKDDIVVVRGKVATNKELGAGYKYAVLVEGAAISSK